MNHHRNFFSGWCPYLLIAIIGFFVYFRAIFLNFTYLDDAQLIIGNYNFLHHPVNFITAFTRGAFLFYQDAYYRPLLTVSFMIDSIFMNTEPIPWIYHLTNIAYHLIAACLVFLLLTRLKYPKPLSLFFSLIFTVHPVLTQAVAWIPGRNDSLLAIFTLSSFLFFLSHIQTQKIKYLLLHLIFFTLALFTKESALLIPLVCLIYSLLIARRHLLTRENSFLGLGWLSLTTFWFYLRSEALTHSPVNPLTDIWPALFANAACQAHA